MYVNGQTYSHRDGLTLHALLADLKVNQKNVVVMHGDDIYRAGKIPDAPLAERDVIEIVTMMAGG
jgi:thiamine biosynthesis protein ThiS